MSLGEFSHFRRSSSSGSTTAKNRGSKHLLTRYDWMYSV